MRSLVGSARRAHRPYPGRPLARRRGRDRIESVRVLRLLRADARSEGRLAPGHVAREDWAPARTAERDLPGADPGGESAGRDRRPTRRLSLRTDSDDVVGRPLDGTAESWQVPRRFRT